MTPQHTPQRLQKYFEMKGAVDHSKGALPKRCGKAPGVFPTACLPWSDNDGRRSGVKPSEQLQDSRACNTAAMVLMERDLKVHDRNVYGFVLDQ